MTAQPHPGRVAYAGYCQATDGKSLVSGEPLPEWDQLSEAIQRAWMAAADAARAARAGVTLDPDGRFTLKLQTPVQHGSECISELRFRKVKGRDMRNLPIEGTRTVGHLMEIASKAAGQPMPVIDELEDVDLQEVIAIIGGF